MGVIVRITISLDVPIVRTLESPMIQKKREVRDVVCLIALMDIQSKQPKINEPSSELLPVISREMHR
jgi:hypothetical protein